MCCSDFLFDLAKNPGFSAGSRLGPRCRLATTLSGNIGQGCADHDEYAEADSPPAVGEKAEHGHDNGEPERNEKEDSGKLTSIFGFGSHGCNAIRHRARVPIRSISPGWVGLATLTSRADPRRRARSSRRRTRGSARCGGWIRCTSRRDGCSRGLFLSPAGDLRGSDQAWPRRVDAHECGSAGPTGRSRRVSAIPIFEHMFVGVASAGMVGRSVTRPSGCGGSDWRSPPAGGVGRSRWSVVGCG